MIKHKIAHAWIPIAVISGICALDWFIRGRWPMDFWLGFCGGAFLLADDRSLKMKGTTEKMAEAFGEWLKAHFKNEGQFPVPESVIKKAHLAHLDYLVESTTYKPMKLHYEQYRKHVAEETTG